MSVQPIIQHREDRPIKLDSEDVFRKLVTSVQDYAIFMVDPNGYVATWNKGAQRMKQYTPDEIIGSHFSIFYTDEDKSAGKPTKEVEGALREGRWEDEGWRVRKDGSRFWANVIITPVYADDGHLIGFGKVTRDLTERRLAEQRYRLLIEGVSDYAIFSLDAHGNVTSWNSGAERIKQYRAEEIIGQHFSRFYTPEDAAAGLPQKVLATADREGHFEGEGWRVRKDGTRFWSSVVVTAIRDEAGNLAGFSKVTRDITDRKILLDTIRKHAEELELRIAEREQTNAELEAFSYSVSHDLRAPIRAITGFAEALKEDYGQNLDSTAHEYLQQVLDGAARMNRLVEDLLNYSRLSRVEIGLHPTKVADAVGKAAKQVDPAAGSVACEVPPAAWVIAHEPTLVQLLYNLINNGLKFHSPDVEPRVVVRYAEHGGFGRISVTDNGIGIAPQHQDRVFKVFERLHGIEDYPGTGIGLAIVKRGAERMSGRVGLESELGKGSTFWIELPLEKN